MKSKDSNKGQVTPQVNPTTPQQAIDKFIAQNPNGEITLNDLNKMAPTFSRKEVIDALRQETRGTFVVGRKGRLSRFLTGEKATAVAEGMKQRRSYNSPPEAHVDAKSVGGFSIQVKIGNVIQTIPLEIALVGDAKVAA